MSRRLFVMRHGKSNWGTDAVRDFDRPLAPRGIKDTPRVGRWLLAQGWVPEFFVSSPALRAKETAIRVCEGLGLDRAVIRYDERIYEASVGELIKVLEDCPSGAKRALLVGHNPGLEGLVRFFCPGVSTPGDGKLMPTAAVAHLEMPDDWGALQPGSANLVDITRPKTLK